MLGAKHIDHPFVPKERAFIAIHSLFPLIIHIIIRKNSTNIILTQRLIKYNNGSEIM